MDGERPDVAGGGAALVLGGLSAVVAAQGHTVTEPGHVWEEEEEKAFDLFHIPRGPCQFSRVNFWEMLFHVFSKDMPKSRFLEN